MSTSYASVTAYPWNQVTKYGNQALKKQIKSIVNCLFIFLAISAFDESRCFICITVGLRHI
uniref:Fimbrin n=1 Tax=Solanum tuberosum TaxID=4113 RepID=M1B3E3_SOLTU